MNTLGRLKPCWVSTAYARPRNFSMSPKNHVKVAVVGAAGGIGQPLSLLLKLSPMVTELKLYDIKNVPGVAADLSHIETPAKVTGFNGKEQMDDALRGNHKEPLSMVIIQNRLIQ